MGTPSRITTARRLRRGLALAACTALLGLSACGTDADPETTGPAEQEPASTSEEGASDGGGAAAGTGEQETDASEGEGSGEEDAGSDDGGADEEQDGAGADEGAGEDEGAAGAAGSVDTRVMLATEIPGDPTEGDGWPVLSPDELAGMLGDPLGGTATCEDELELAPFETVSCMGPTSTDQPDPEQEWTASSVTVPASGEVGEGGSVAVLFTTGGELSDSALLEEGTDLTGLGFGSMFGAEDLDADELEESTLQVLTSDNAIAPVDDADWKSVTCEDGLSFASFTPTVCQGETGDGEEFTLKVAPGAFVDTDPGLLVGIVSNMAD
jgi:hypothetical protein